MNEKFDPTWRVIGAMINDACKCYIDLERIGAVEGARISNPVYPIRLNHDQYYRDDTDIETDLWFLFGDEGAFSLFEDMAEAMILKGFAMCGSGIDEKQLRELRDDYAARTRETPSIYQGIVRKEGRGKVSSRTKGTRGKPVREIWIGRDGNRGGS